MDARTVLVLNGPNLNLLGEREPEVYGSATLADVEALCREAGRRAGLVLDFRQTNHEGTLVDWVQEGRAASPGSSSTPPATPTPRSPCATPCRPVACPASRCTSATSTPARRSATTVHLSDVCDHHVIGHGVQGYAEAVTWVAEHRGA